MKFLWQCSKWLLLSVLGALLLYAVLAFLLSWWSTNPTHRDCPAENTIYVTTGGVHLDIIIPTRHLTPELRHPSYTDSRTQYVAFGWGERNFYLETPTWGDLTLKNAASALLINSETVMHLRNYRRARESWQEVPLCDAALSQLVAYITASFAQNTNGDWIAVPAEGYQEHDFFYVARGKYNAFNTCNIWINDALKAAEVKTSVWSPLKYGVLYHL